uniref:beta-1,3-galactosyl-O-glycosyl-glycoprotein beta-1,6-N-acetylglucosaminyltransferase-like isoform X2 n=1 Tax=Styela clava TaxID=7725 RepID=UPI001939F5C7|nr:beta-1,3-galactosyl-O-glycosyl-glycoprotein beta-1,6-N-acetylglucosaminyltransferase-like isoform X2 [Styela clava]
MKLDLLRLGGVAVLLTCSFGIIVLWVYTDLVKYGREWIRFRPGRLLLRNTLVTEDKNISDPINTSLPSLPASALPILQNEVQSKYMMPTKDYLTSLRFIKNQAMTHVDCDAIMRGDKTAIKVAGTEREILYSEKNGTRKNMLLNSDQTVASRADNCTLYVKSRKYITSPLTLEEAEYPIAYIISIYKKNDYRWHYVINTCGQDYPTKTNLEIIRALKTLDGLNSVPSRTIKITEEKYRRFQFVYNHSMNIDIDHGGLYKTDVKKEPPPHNIQPFTGKDYFVFKREAVEFLLTDQRVLDFLEWAKDTKIPDETVWATLQRMYPRVPGSTPPDKKYDTYSGNTLSRTQQWQGPSTICGGKFLRRICVYGCADLNGIIEKKPLFANKFATDVDIFAMNCLAEWIRNRTID